MFFTAIAGIGGILQLPWLGWVAEQILATMVTVVHWCASLPWAQSDVSWAWWGIVLYGATVVVACLYMKWQTGYNLRSANLVE